MKDIKTMLNEWKTGKLENGVFATTDENGDNVIVEVTPNYIKLSTMQKNNWQRINYYYEDGTTEEIYE